ncbi:MFS transporter, FHS family, L-fucose permease [Fonsecaea erecta]|uniref:MFS transporter, FHS family, L-fucose permease n=1 Tax=Fonsecaea erecta TaxID=1367422 RepID=A0A178ZPB3_9EURO|nr:MFS transporter, FHS family, L-fucose permease [Fonsecaea erecta]OAP60845.1 MFS transporter, FHS family, L-fucose permease [Fonsecaea erecta]
MVPDRGPATSAVTIVITVLATVFVAARFYTRAWLVRSIKQDDWWILAAWVFAVGFSTSICVAVKYGLGKHKQNIPDDAFSALRKAEYAFDILYNPALMLTKTSIIVFFLSVMSKDVDPVFKWCNWLTLAVVNIAGIALTLFNIFQCSPVSAGYLYPQPAHARCTDIVTLYLSSAPLNIITDIAILFLPMPILTGMRLPRKQKIILVATFSFGAFVAVVDVIRIAYLQQASLNRLKVVDGAGGSPSHIVEDNDFSWYASLSFMWSAVEVCIGIICACVPSLKPLFARFLPSFIRDAGDELASSNSIDLGKADEKGQRTDLPRGNVSILNNPAAFRRSIVKEYSGDEDGGQMGFLNFLAEPTDEGHAGPSLPNTADLSRRTTNKSAVSDFGFVKMSGKRNMLKLSNRQSAWPIAVVTIIFFLWGFAYGLLDTLNSQFQAAAKVSPGKALGLHAAYYGGYFAGPLTLGHFIFQRYGFKAVMIVGLAVYGCGTLVFWPSGVLLSYPAFVVSNCIVGFGLSCLEIAANPYIALCGPLEYAEARLNLSQAFQAIGTVCSPLLATKVLFKSVHNAPSLVDVQWAYLGIALFVFALAVVFYYVPLPEASNEQLEELADQRQRAYAAKIGPWKVKYVTLGLAVFSQWCYVGAQECVGNNIQGLIVAVTPASSLHPFDFSTVGHTVFAVGRFVAAFLNYVLKPRWILMGLYVGLVVCVALNMHLDGDAAAAIGMLTFFFEAGIFSIIFAVAMRGLGRHTKAGSALMTAAISGGAVFPPVQWAVAKGSDLRYSYCVPLAVAAFGMLFAIYLNLMPQARTQVDPVHGTRAKRGSEQATGRQSPSIQEDETLQQFGLPGIIARRKRKHRPESPSVEHIERQSTNLEDVPNSPVLMMDFADEKNCFPKPMPVVQQKQSKGHVAELALWPVGEDVSEASASSSGASGQLDSREPRHTGPAVADQANNEEIDVISRRHRPVWGEQGEDRDDDIDDYHAIMRKI